MKKESILLPAFLAAAALLFTVVFGTALFDFWWSMAGASGALAAGALVFDNGLRREIISDAKKDTAMKVLVGISSAAFLYLVFSIGNVLSQWIIPGAASYIGNVYSLREGQSLIKIVLIIAFIVGPAEEIFWRGYLQKSLAQQMPVRFAVILSTLVYSLVHLASGNPMLLIAAFVCGLFWGCLYAWRKSLVANCISHVIWDLSVFVLFPF